MNGLQNFLTKKELDITAIIVQNNYKTHPDTSVSALKQFKYLYEFVPKL